MEGPPGATPADGVNVGGYFRAEVGVGEAGRLLVAALRAAEIPYALVPFEEVPSRQESTFADWGDGAPVYDTNIVSVNSNALPAFARAVGREFFEGRHTIGMWWWEVESFPKKMQVGVDYVDEVWVGSRHAANAIAPAIPRPVLICPPPVVRRTPEPRTRDELGLPDGFAFLFLFDFNSVVERKNPTAAIRAFAQAFAPGEGPVLVLKSVNGFQRAAKLEALRASAGDRPDILIVDRYLDDGELHSLIASCDAYVSLHRGEGFGLTMAEAMAFGKPVIATAYGGNLEFMNARNSWLVDYRLTPIPPGCEPYPAGTPWADPDVHGAAEAMRTVYAGGDDVRARAEQGASDIRELHSPEARAEFLRERLGTIRRLRRLAAPGASRGGAWAPAAAHLTAHPATRFETLTAIAPPRTLRQRLLAWARRPLYRLLAPPLMLQADFNDAVRRAVEALQREGASRDR